MLKLQAYLKYPLIFIFTGIISVLNAQDTLWVRGFSYTSKTRDSLITFPTGDHNKYEKILMYYAMRCKNGLVSTATDRNKGCGEWDYSCNTNIIDSTGIDSLQAFHPNYIINGVNDNYFYYTTKPTYTYYDFAEKKLTINAQSATTYAAAGTHLGNTEIKLPDNNLMKAYYLFKASELQGLGAGNLAGLQCNSTAKGQIPFFKIKMALTPENELTMSLLKNINFVEVLNRKVDISTSGKTDIIFHQTFPYNGNGNIVLEISYTDLNYPPSEVGLKSSINNTNVALSNSNADHYVEFGNQGGVRLPVSGLSTIKDQITVAFWSKGNEKYLPANTSAFYAEDSNKNRQLNVHLPWSNSRIYWDCGGDATGYDRIDKAANISEFSGTWNHWAFTKNKTTGSMKIYLNGVLWHSATGKTKAISIDQMTLGADIANSVPYSGNIDDFGVWDKELSVAEIKSVMFDSPVADPTLDASLVAYYDMNEQAGLVLYDRSKNKLSASFSETPVRKYFRGSEVFKGFVSLGTRPDISFIKGTFNISTSVSTVRDSIINTPVKVVPYTLVNGIPQAQNPLYVWASGFMPVYDENGTLTDEVEVPEDDIIFIENLTYFQKSPAKYELLSFVTPYGIGLDLGKDGKTWIFDVTDYGPILKNKKRLLMDKGGEWQEEIDIRFAFVKGKPSRPVLSINQVWPATAYGYSSILNNTHLEPRYLFCNPEVKSMKVRTVTTGHGQEGEFIPRSHSISVNGGSKVFNWQLLKECADNPIYPQGGTWIYDRAGWCPGAPSDLREFEIMPYVKSEQPFSLDYGLNTASGDSRYIVNTQLVKYGEPTFNLDAAIDEIITPSQKVVYQRINPICANPVIVLKNNGKIPLTSAVIRYGVEGNAFSTYTWTGRLEFLQTQKITLPNLSPDHLFFGSRFIAFIEHANNSKDEYPQNDRLQSDYQSTPFLEGSIIVAMKTNAMPNETKWSLRDENGTTIKSSKPNLSAFSLYQDTIRGLSGCYQLQFTDSDDDGISWWANGDGDGYIQAKGITGSWHILQPDFGKELTFNFVTGLFIGTQDISKDQSAYVVPNPTTGEVIVHLKGLYGETLISVLHPSGKMLSSGIFFNNSSSEDQVKFDFSAFSAGMYFLSVHHQNFNQILKVVKY
jgi:hypothetical protein